MNILLCLFRLSVRSRTSITTWPNFANLFCLLTVTVTMAWFSWRRGNTLYNSGFVDDIKSSIREPKPALLYYSSSFHTVRSMARYAYC